jgi:hypothetical protein
VKTPKAKVKVPAVKPPVRPPVKRPAAASKPAIKVPVNHEAPKPAVKTVKTTTGKIKVPETLLADKGRPPLYETLSMLGLFLAAMRSHEEAAAAMALQHVGGFMMDLQKYGLKMPARELEDLRHYAMSGAWAQAYKALQTFSNAFGPELRKAIEKDNSVPAEAFTLADTFLKMIAVRSVSRWDNMESAAINKFKYLGNPALAQMWRVKVEGDQEAAVDELHAVVKEAYGSDREGEAAYTLSFEEKNALRESNPTLNDRYNKAFNAAMKKYRATLRNWVLDHNDTPQPVPEARTKMEAEGFYLHDLRPEMDSLLVGSDGFFYTEYEGQILKLLSRPGAGTTIGRFNPDYNPTKKGSSWKFEYKTDQGEFVKCYSELTKRTFKTDKSDSIIPMLTSVPKVRPRWLKDILHDDDHTSVPALMTEICYLACARIGGDGFTRGFGKTYGLSTLEVQHCKLEKNKVTLHYPGKDAKDQTHVFRDSNKDEHRVAACLRVLCEGKKKTDMLFTFDDGKHCSNTRVRDYMKTLGVEGLTPHKLRSINGTNKLLSLLSKYSDKDIAKMSPTAADKLFKEEAIEVGKLLGHVAGGVATAATALKNYIDPVIAQDWFTSHGLRTPIWVKSTLRDKD